MGFAVDGDAQPIGVAAVVSKDSAAVAKKKARIAKQGMVHGYVNTTPYENMPSTSLGNGNHANETETNA